MHLLELELSKRTCKEWSLKLWSLRRIPAGLSHGCFWNSLLSVLSPTLLSRTCLFPFLHGSTCLNSVSSSCLPAPWKPALPLSRVLSAVPDTKETVHNSLRKEGMLDGAHSSCPQWLQSLSFDDRTFVFTSILTASSPSSPSPPSLPFLWVVMVEFPASSSQHQSWDKGLG